jgi:hypothetical protein
VTLVRELYKTVNFIDDFVRNAVGGIWAISRYETPMSAKSSSAFG